MPDEVRHLAIAYETENAFDSGARGFGASAPRPALTRYVVPGDIVVAVAVALSHAFDALRMAAVASAEDNGEAVAVSLRYLHGRLDTIHEAVVAVVSAHPEEVPHGSHRPC